jgi:hypothetical protein
MATDREIILRTLDEYAATYCAKDTDRLMALFVEGENISLIGTGSDELCSGRDAIAAVFTRNFKEATARRFELGVERCRNSRERGDGRDCPCDPPERWRCAD